METFERDLEKAKEDFNQFLSSSGKEKLGESIEKIKNEVYSLQNIYDQSYESERAKIRELRNHLEKCENLICEQRDKNKNADYTPISRIIENLKYGVDEYQSEVGEF